MPTERLGFLMLAVAIAVAILLAGPVAFAPGWDKAAHFAAFSALTVCLWQASAGEMPVFVLAGVVAFAAMDEVRQAHLPDRMSDAQDFLTDIAAALVTAALLFMKRKTRCAESSPR